MGAFEGLYQDIKSMEEKLQTLRGSISEEEYEEIENELRQIKSLGSDIEDIMLDSDKVSELITRLAKLEVQKFSKNDVKDVAKSQKRKSFLDKLEYIAVCQERGDDVKDVILSAREYWKSISSNYNELERLEVERMLDELAFEYAITNIKSSNEIDYSVVSSESSYLLIRNKLQEIYDNKETSPETRMLISSWLGESIDINTGKIDNEAMQNVVSDKRLWEVLAGVENVGVNQLVKRPSTELVIPNNDKGSTENEERQRVIKELSEKYGIPLRKFNFKKKKFEYAILIKRCYNRLGNVSYKLTTEEKECEELEWYKRGDGIVAVIYNNDVTSVRENGDITYGDLEDVVFPDNLISIGENVFYRSKLKKVIFPKSTKTIGDNSFKNSSLLEEIVLTDGVEAIGELAFANCGLTQLEIPATVKRIEPKAFQCNPLCSVKFNYGLKEIKWGSFHGCKLDSVSIPKSVYTVGERAFSDNLLTRIKLSKGTKVGKDAFANNVNVCIEYDSSSEMVKSQDSQQGNIEESLEKLSEEKKRLQAELKRVNERLKQLNKDKSKDLDK